MTKSIRHKTVSGVRVTVSTTLITGIIQTAFLVILARALSPRDYGIAAIGLVLVAPLEHILFAGLERAVIITAGEFSGEELAQLNTLNLYIGLFSASIVFSAAAIGSFIPGFGIYSWTILCLSPMALLNGLTITARTHLRRTLAYRELAAADLAAQVTQSISTLAGALIGLGSFAITLGIVLRAGVRAAVNLYNARLGLTFASRLNLVAPIVRTSFSISKTSILELTQINLPTLFIGPNAGPVSLGLYNRGYYLIQLPVELLLSAMNRVMFSVFNIVREDRDRLLKGSQSLVEIAGAVCVPLCFGTAAASPEVVRVLLGTQWLRLTAFMPLLCIITMISMLSATLSVINEASTYFDQRFFNQFTAVAATSVALGVVVLNHWGLSAYCLAVLVGNVIMFAGNTILSAKVLRCPRHRILWWLFPSVACGIFLTIGVTIVRLGLASLPAPLVLLAEMAVCSIGQFTLYAVFWRRTLLEVLSYSGLPLPGRFRV